MMFRALPLWCAISCLSVVHSEDDHDHDHDHDHHGHEGAYEWAGIFTTPGNTYMWTAQKVEGAYADPSMKLAALPATDSTEEVLSALAGEGAHALEQTCIEVEAGGVIVPMEDRCYNLHFKQDWWQSLYTVNATGIQAIAFFAEHVPTEFESTAHYLKDEDGTDIEPDAEKNAHSEEAAEKEKPWGPALMAAVIVNVVTLIGVVLLVPAVAKLAGAYAEQFFGVMSGFVAGALLSCAFFLLLFEATHLVATGWDEEVDVLWRWGTMVLAGFALPPMIDVVTGAIMAFVVNRKALTGKAEGQSDAEKQPAEADAQDADSTMDTVTKSRLIGSILVGDFFHNFGDGIFLGAAYSGCGESFGWGVLLGTVLHELPQELGDFAVLTSPQAGLGPLTALLLNFLSGLGVILGAIVVLANDIDDAGIGLLLSFAGGVYLHIGATECMPKIYSAKLSPQCRMLSVAAFFIGATLIGLVLLDHEHCVPEGAGGDGHAHHHH